MRIAIQASDLDRERIDGTRVYLKELLNRFGGLAPRALFVLYHERDFYTLLAPKHFQNYQEKKIPFFFAWMQTRFAWSLFLDTPKKLFLPIQAAPLILPRHVEVTATIHDLAWKKYPQTFSWKDRFKLNLLLKRVVCRADKLIAVSEATKKDLLSYFPSLSEEKVRVIYHGFDTTFFSKRLTSEELVASLSKYNVTPGTYALYVGALQPRKNLVRLIQAFEGLKKEQPQAKLVLAGEVAWLAEATLQAREESVWREDILLLGKVSFEDLRALYQGARMFVFPSLYEGFGLPLLEAFASETPVLTADNSSLVEVAGEAALFCDALDVEDITQKLCLAWSNEALRQSLVAQGRQQVQKFSWDTCAKKTIDYLEV